jgi:hypothetical protein
MMISDTARNAPIISDDRLRGVLQRHIYRVMKIDRTFTRTLLSEESGVNVHTIDAINSNDPAKHRKLCFSDGLSLAVVMGPPAVSAVLGLIGWVGRPEDEGDVLNPMAIAAGGMGCLATIAAAAADNRFDHTEKRVVQESADQLIAIVLPLSSAGRSPDTS